MKPNNTAEQLLDYFAPITQAYKWKLSCPPSKQDYEMMRAILKRIPDRQRDKRSQRFLSYIDVQIKAIEATERKSQ